MNKNLKIICPYPTDFAPSQRFRFEQYLSFLNQEGFKIAVHPFLNEKQYLQLYKQGKIFSKTISILFAFTKRFGLLFSIKKTDIVFIHREASPIGPPIFEYIIAKWIKVKIIYDFDDAIWLPNTSESNKIAAKFKYHGKVAKICKWSTHVICGNQFLADYARKYNDHVHIIPTTIDLGHHVTKADQKQSKTIIGWTGSHSTLPYLKELQKPLKELSKEIDFEFYVISDEAPNFEIPNLKFIPWSKTSEINELAKFDIGLMPLPNEEWAKGKCSFKALQYMAMKIPLIISAVGMNKELIENDVNGFLIYENDQWLEAMRILINDASKRKQFSELAFQKIEVEFSVDANKYKYLELLKAI